MRHRAVAVIALAFGILGSSNAGAVRPQPVEDTGLITPVWTPLGVSKAPVTVVVQLAGESVAEQQGNAGRKLERNEKERSRGELRNQQEGLRGSIESLGGSVAAHYQAAYNGIKVRIAADRAKEIATLPGVVAVRPLQLMKPDNVRGVPFIGTPAVWQSLGLHGEGVKVAIIDSGIDYTHANFGGPGTAAAYTGPSNASTIGAPDEWNVGPGVAPKADLYAVRVFGCAGVTDVVVDAIEWAVDNDMDVINMSLVSPFGSKDDPVAVASTNAAKAGVIVVASAGNSGASPYVTSSPASADGAISVAANDPYSSFPGATLSFSGTTIPAINANGFALSGSATFNIKVIRDDPTTSGHESLGCSVAAFGLLGPNTIAVVNRGACARVAKAIFGQQAGAAAVVMANDAPDFPPFEGPISSNPDDGTPFDVTIPFLGV